MTHLNISSVRGKKIKARGALIFCVEKIWVGGFGVGRQVMVFKPALGIVKIKNITEKLVTPASLKPWVPVSEYPETEAMRLLPAWPKKVLAFPT